MLNPSTRPPGIYEDRGESRYTSLVLRERGVVAFVGMAQRGPLNLPVKLFDFTKFREIYGALDEPTFLASSVESFFENGGVECYVLRVAHSDPRRPGELAALGSVRLHDKKMVNTIVLNAINEGEWGNSIQVEVTRPQQVPRTFLTLDLKKGQMEATLKSTHGISRGTQLRVFDDDGNQEILEVASIKGRVVTFAPETVPQINHSSSAPSYVEPVLFGLYISYLGKTENFEKLSFSKRAPNYFESLINIQSELIRVTNLESSTTGPDNLPVNGQKVVLSGGADGLHGVTPEDFLGMNQGPDHRYGLAALEVIEDIDMLCCPDLMWAYENSTGFNSLKDIEVVQQAMVTQCEVLRDRFSILDIPNGSSPSAALQWRQLFDSAYGAFYFPWILVKTQQGDQMVPPSGMVAGIYARCDQAIGLHKAPANEELRSALDVAVDLSDVDAGTLNQQGINCIRPFPARGIRVWGARTASSNAQHRYITVRRITSAVIRSMYHDLQWVVFEPNTPNLWKKVMRNVSYFLYDLWKRGYFKGDSPEKAFFVKCDEENNSPDTRDQGMVIVDVGISPVRPAEFVMFRIVQESEQSFVQGS
jgi:hypothetical protein